jgi:hypothetical protein
MFNRFEINYIFCGYEYFWKYVDFDGNEFKHATKDIPFNVGIYRSAACDDDKFIKEYVQIGNKKIKIKSVELITKVPFSQFSRKEFKIRFFGKSLPKNMYWGPAREEIVKS